MAEFAKLSAKLGFPQTFAQKRLPRIGQQKGGTKDLIIELLSREWPLSAKEIHNRLKREHSSECSYQATHKLLNQLAEEKVVVKEGKNYGLDKGWIKNLKNLGSDLEEKYLRNVGTNALKKLEEQGAANVTVNGILETSKFILEGLAYLPNPEKKPNFFLWRNVYSIIGLGDSDYAAIAKHFGSEEWYAVASEDNLMDRMFADTLSKYGVKNILDVKDCATTLNDTIVVGDYVATLWYPPEFRGPWYLQNKEPKNLTDFDLREHLNKMRNVKAEINFVVVKNAGLAEQIRRQYLPLFKGKRK